MPIAAVNVPPKPQNKKQTEPTSANVPVRQTPPAQKRATAAS